jgi:hypothetical protein
MLLPKVKLKTLPTFPSVINGGTGIDVTRQNGALTVDLDYSEFGAVSVLPTSPTNYILTYDTMTASYVMIPSSLLGGGVSGIADAPVNGIQYGRQSAGWTPVVAGVTSTFANGIKTGVDGISRLDYVTVLDNIDNTGATDVGALINAAILAAPSYSTIILPIGKYLTSQTINIYGNVTLVGMTGGFFAGGLTNGSCIIGTLGCNPVVNINGNPGSGRSGLSNIQISRAAGVVSPATEGLLIQNCNNTTISEVFVERQGYGFVLGTNNVAINFERCHTATINNAHCVIGGGVEITFNDCVWGMNGAVDVTCSHYNYFTGSDWDTIRFHGCQWNQGLGPPDANISYGMTFANYTGSPNGNGEIFISNLHCEGTAAYFLNFVSCTVKIPRLTFSNCEVNVPSPFFGGGNSVIEFVMTGCRIWASDFTLDRQVYTVLTGNEIASTFLLNATTNCVVSGNLFTQNVTLVGACTKTLFGSNVTMGTFSNTATGITLGTNA